MSPPSDNPVDYDSAPGAFASNPQGGARLSGTIMIEDQTSGAEEGLIDDYWNGSEESSREHGSTTNLSSGVGDVRRSQKERTIGNEDSLLFEAWPAESEQAVKERAKKEMLHEAAVAQRIEEPKGLGKKVCLWCCLSS